ncbi:MAG: N-acetyltransferase [Burkholderiales bacterium]|nr:N-acetyltransferase [Burkholderiales bacterium]
MVNIRPATLDDATAIVAIYNRYVAETAISFEEVPVDGPTMQGRIQGVLDAGLPWLVAEYGGNVLGYAYATPWRTRSAYRYAAESTVYLSPDAQGRGIGSALYTALIGQLRERKLHTVIGGIAQPNAASVALHEKLGFKRVAMFEQVGWKFDRWVDVGYWQLVLESR